MARITIAQLTAQLEASHVSYERVVAERDSLIQSLRAADDALAALKAEHEALAAQVHDLIVDRDAAKHPAAPRYQRQSAPRDTAYRAACAAARAMAMKTGRSVKVC